MALLIIPPLIFLGVGAMTDFGPMIANPKLVILGAGAHLGIFVALIGAKVIGFSINEAGAIGIIGGADGPMAIFVTMKLAPHLLPQISVAAYSYMALMPLIQPPVMKLLTTKDERADFDGAVASGQPAGKDRLPDRDRGHRLHVLPAGRAADHHADAGQPAEGGRRRRPPGQDGRRRPDERHHHHPHRRHRLDDGRRHAS